MNIKIKDNFEAKPFLKWVGGKKGLLYELERLAPKEYNNYFEPFIGGGALFFKLNPHKAFLNDSNGALISAYRNIKNEPNKVINHLEKLRTRFYAQKDEQERKEMFYEIRESYNSMSGDSTERTAYLIFLNKTCFNGMYRENSKGGFNVPFGKYKNPSIFDKDNILAISKSLKDVTLTNKSFEEAVENAQKGDLVYFDPPYHPLNKTSSFTSYTKDDFSEDDQRKLKGTFDKLHKKGCYVMLSNSYTEFIQDLYAEYKQVVVYANRAVNCKAKGRGKIKELVVINY